jgi:hypothetical protein
LYGEFENSTFISAKWKKNIKFDPEEAGCESVEWI